MAQQPPVGHGLLIIEASRSHSDTPHSVGLLWASDQPDSETTKNIHDRHTCPRRNSNRQSQQASSRRPTPLTRDRHFSAAAKFIIRITGSVGPDISTRHSYNPTNEPSTSSAKISKILSLTVIYLFTHLFIHSCTHFFFFFSDGTTIQCGSLLP